MASEQAKQTAQQYASVRERTSKPDLDLATRRDIDESLHSVAREPERVSFAEVDADSVPALWCIPERSDAEHVLRAGRIRSGISSSSPEAMSASTEVSRSRRRCSPPTLSTNSRSR